MENLIRRINNNDTTCIGSWYIGHGIGVTGAPEEDLDWRLECRTLEDTVRLDDPSTPQDESKKVYGKTAIPAGRYEIILGMSPKFGRIMPRFQNVLGFSGILAHSGCTAEDTLGCVCVGSEIDSDRRIHGGSRAFPVLMRKFEEAEARGERIFVTIVNSFLEG